MKKRTLIAILIFFLALPFSLSAQQEDVYSVRRKRVMEKMDGGIAILTSETSSERLNKHFYYLTGLKDPETTLILIPDGDVKEKIPKIVKVPAGEIYQRTETPRGELGYYIISDGGKIPNRIKVRSPAFCNLSVLPAIAKGAMIADLVAIIGSLDIVLGEIDR